MLGEAADGAVLGVVAAVAQVVGDGPLGERVHVPVQLVVLLHAHLQHAHQHGQAVGHRHARVVHRVSLQGEDKELVVGGVVAVCYVETTSFGINLREQIVHFLLLNMLLKLEMFPYGSRIEENVHITHHTFELFWETEASFFVTCIQCNYIISLSCNNLFAILAKYFMCLYLLFYPSFMFQVHSKLKFFP